MKKDGDLPRAGELFEKALAFNPRHEDSRYYLAHCLAAQGDLAGAVAQLEELVRINPQSHRGHLQLGKLRALAATSRADLEAAEEALQRAAALNPEETGALQVLGEIALLRSDLDAAASRLEAVSRTNPRAVGALFLRGYIAWKRGEQEEARRLLKGAQKARGPDWKPQGAVAEGDVARRMHQDETPTSRFWEQWDGKPDPAPAFHALDSFLAALPGDAQGAGGVAGPRPQHGSA
jgi:tetratricopeptide (TPR) repeat protein